MEWQPIETAPKDGSAVLVFGGTVVNDQQTYCSEEPCGYVSIAYFQDSGTCRHHWRGDNCGGHDEYNWHDPTHWMPLPEPPPENPS